MGERLRGHLVFAVVVCAATSGITMLVAYEQDLEGRIPATILRLARSLAAFGPCLLIASMVLVLTLYSIQFT